MQFCQTCGGRRDWTLQDWPVGFRPQGPDHVPGGLCNGVCGPPGAPGPLLLNWNEPEPRKIGFYAYEVFGGVAGQLTLEQLSRVTFD